MATLETQTSTEARTILRLTGADAREFLQGLVTNDVARLDQGLVYAALLTPQGKYLSDFFLVPQPDAILIDLPADQAADVLKRITLYKLRAQVAIEETDWRVARGLDVRPEGAFEDPRDLALGWRHYGPSVAESDDMAAAIETRRIARGIPKAGVELIPGDGYILEAGFERLNGVDFRKGCFVGQEIVARMKHKLELRKGLTPVAVEGAAPVGTEILREGKSVGTLFSQAEGHGIAFLRFDRTGPGMVAGDAAVTLREL